LSTTIILGLETWIVQYSQLLQTLLTDAIAKTIFIYVKQLLCLSEKVL